MSDYIKLDAGGAGLMHVTGDAENDIFIHKNVVQPLALHVNFAGRGNTLWIDEGCRLQGQVLFIGSNGKARFSASGMLNVIAAVYDDGSLTWGPGCTGYQVRVWVHGGRNCTIGAGCLFSENIHIRTSDHHSIIDLDSGEVLNHAADVIIGDRVWIGEGARIGKGVTIGDGAIVAGSAYVSSDIPPAELWGGLPAKRLRGNVSWVDEFPASEAAAAQMIEWINARRPALEEAVSSPEEAGRTNLESVGKAEKDRMQTV
ncbi:acyltransferase [Brevundimonas albigilva]|uniref:acyltransferase n=1 Tax=Brevundimonas albigilva TaxID=1312364 RepID=UPI00201B8C2C|nr:acyltransferase [Brevundimonas albigilva]UQV17199.1 acyltransferase [Brevundimonas albigilva]